MRELTEQDWELFRASENHDPDSVMRLVNEGADVNAAQKDGWTPLCSAICTGDLASVLILLCSGAKVDARHIRIANDSAEYAIQNHLCDARDGKPIALPEGYRFKASRTPDEKLRDRLSAQLLLDSLRPGFDQ